MLRLFNNKGHIKVLSSSAKHYSKCMCLYRNPKKYRLMSSINPLNNFREFSLTSIVRLNDAYTRRWIQSSVWHRCSYVLWKHPMSLKHRDRNKVADILQDKYVWQLFNFIQIILISGFKSTYVNVQPLAMEKLGVEQATSHYWNQW